MSIRLKITLPYLILAIITAIIVTYFVANRIDSLFGISIRTIYVILFTVILLSIIVIGFIVSRLIMNPMHKLINASQAIASGDLEKRTGISSNDEVGVLASTFDEMVSRLQERTLALEESNEILKKVDKTKTNFITISAHELRTPLTLIMGYSQMLAEDFKQAGPEMSKLANGILEGSERMTGVVDSMLDVSRIDSNALVLRKVAIEIAHIIRKVQREFAFALNERNISFEAIDLESLPSIIADPDMIQKVFYHLIMNAIKYTPDGGTITITGKYLTGDTRSYLEIAIRDTGIGVDSSMYDLIFQKFHQTGEVLLHSSGKTKFKGGGPGLGLAIARGIVEAHGGKIWVESPGQDEEKFPGSTFYVRFPVVQVPQ